MSHAGAKRDAMDPPIGDALEASSSASSEFIISIALAAYVGVSLTILFWVPIVATSGDCALLGMRFKTPSLTILFIYSLPSHKTGLLRLHLLRLPRVAHLRLALLLYRAPPLGLLWLAVVVLRLVQFSRLGSRAPLPHGLHAPSPADEESGAAPLKTSASSSCCTASAVSNSSSSRVVSASPPPSSPRCVVDADAPTASASAPPPPPSAPPSAASSSSATARRYAIAA